MMRSRDVRGVCFAAAMWLVGTAFAVPTCGLFAQEPGKPAATANAGGATGKAGGVPETGARPAAAADKFREAFAAGSATGSAAPAATAAPPPPGGSKEMNLFELTLAGGPIMIPIGMMSIVMVIFAVERWIALRTSRVLPPELVQGLGQLASRPGGLDPRLAYRLCQKHRSAAGRVVRAALLKVGRPHQEVEKAVADASEREAEELYANVRHINLVMAVSPLLGLLGTVWGMVETFFRVSQATQTVKVADLAGGIYVALVTTVAGLVVAIPAALISHYFEGRIQAIFRNIQDLVDSLLPQLERYEGKLRVSLDSPPAEAPPVAPQPAAVGAGPIPATAGASYPVPPPRPKAPPAPG